MSFRDRYVENHGLEFDVLYSDCRDCYLNNLECLHYTTGCRRDSE